MTPIITLEAAMMIEVVSASICILSHQEKLLMEKNNYSQ
jgi:hypothetical protein